MGNKAHQKRPPETVAAVGICRCFEKNFDNLALQQKKSEKSSTFIQTSDWEKNYGTKL